MSKAAPTHLLTQEQLHFYAENGYLHLKSVVPESLLCQTQISMTDWVDRTIAKWIKRGLIDKDFSQFSFETRLFEAWKAANYPPCNPMLAPEVFNKDVFDFMRAPVFIDAASDVMGTENIMASWGFTCRPKLPPRPPEAAEGAPWIEIDVPWHQDAQYSADVAANFIIIWIPFVNVDEKKSPLQLAAGNHRDGLYKNHKHAGYCSIHPDEVHKLTNLKTIEMKRGDMLCMNALLPHRSLANQNNQVRWSMDLRFINIDLVQGSVPGGGFVCANTDASKIDTSFDACYEMLQAQYVKTVL